jgi:hypothetical protein
MTFAGFAATTVRPPDSKVSVTYGGKTNKLGRTQWNHCGTLSSKSAMSILTIRVIGIPMEPATTIVGAAS